MPHALRFVPAATVAALLILGPSAALAQPDRSPTTDGRIDGASGRDKANWRRDRAFDHVHMRLEIDIPDMEVQVMNARCSWTVVPITTEQTSIAFDARPTLKFSTITVDGQACAFTHENNVLRVALPRAARPLEPVTVVMTYVGDKPYGSLSGFLGPTGLSWFKTSTRANRQSQGAQIYSQGEAEWNSFWFPCHDSPDERVTTELIVTAPDPYEVISNGRLSSVMRTGTRSTWHWKQDKPHANYLVSLVVGRFDHITVGGPESARPGLEISVYAPLGAGEAARKTYAVTPEMIAFLEEKLDQPYPWDKYAQTLVRNFPGGMENTSATTMGDFSARAGEGGADDLIVHELGHQWFGDLVTCRTWAHLWLNEGWATYVEFLWDEHRGGHEGYIRAVRNRMAGFAGRNNASLPQSVPMVSNRYSSPEDTFGKIDDVYAKGGLFLHALRMRIGDEAFWKGVRAYLKKYRFTPVETDDFRKVMEEASGQSLERFFWQYCYRAGVPVLNVTADWDSAAGALKVVVEQTQKIDADNPAYALTIPIYCTTGENDGAWVYVDTDQKRVEVSLPVSTKPSKISVDPNATVIGRWTVKSSL